jgi:hypothetical protein
VGFNWFCWLRKWLTPRLFRAMARTEGIFAGTSSGGSISAALRLSHSLSEGPPAVIAAIVCDRGDRYLSTGMFDESASKLDPKPVSWRFWQGAAGRMVAYPGPQFVVFVGAGVPPKGPDVAEDLKDGEWWDERSKEVIGAIREAVKKRGGTLLEVRAGTEGEWRDGVTIDGQTQRHPLPDDTSARLRDRSGKPVLPVLCRYEDGAIEERVVLTGGTSANAIGAAEDFVNAR